MIEKVLWFQQNYTLQYSNKLHTNDLAIIFFHGFPAEPVLNAALDKNKDIAKTTAIECGVDTFVMHYKGLGNSKPGAFSFIDSIKESIDLKTELLKKYKKISFFGHSWGGFVTLHALTSLPIDRVEHVYLHAPFTSIPDRIEMKKILEYVSSGLPEIINEKNIDFYLNEFELLKKESKLKEIKNRLKLIDKLQISQSLNDLEVPEPITSKFINELNIENKYKILDTDHTISLNRSAVIKNIVGFFKC